VRRAGRVAGALGLLAAPVLAGCAGSSGPPGSPGLAATSMRPAPAGLSATLSQDRLDADAHRITASIRNDSAHPMRIGQVALAAAQFTPAAPTTWNMTLPAHDELDLWFGYGNPVCPAGAGAPAPSMPALDLTLGSGDTAGAAAPTRLPVTGDVLVGQLAADGCAEHAVAVAVDITYGPAWRRTRIDGLPALVGELQLTRGTARGQVTVTDYQGSPVYQLLALPPARLPQVALPAAAATERLPVVIRVGRCDSHGLTEAKRLFAWRVYVRIGAGPEQKGNLEPPDELRARVHALLADCGTRPVAG